MRGWRFRVLLSAITMLTMRTQWCPHGFEPDDRPKQAVPCIRQRNSIPFQGNPWKNTCCQREGRKDIAHIILSFCGGMDGIDNISSALAAL